MTYYLLVFLTGDLYLQTFRMLPATVNVLYLVLASLLISLLCRRFSYGYLPLVFAAGFAWSAWQAHDALSWTLPAEIENKPMIVRGTIASLPVTHEFGTRFLFSLEGEKAQLSLNNQDANLGLHAGDKWQFLARLKRTHGVQSPGAFDYEAWSLQNHIRATGYILTSSENLLLASNWYDYTWQRFRENLKSKILSQNLNPSLLALMLGERQGFTPENWQVLRSTGTNHLMAIAGLHIGIVALMIHGLVTWVWRRNERWMLLVPVTHASAVAALIVAFIYSALAGFSLPAQRACLMLGIYVYTLLKRETTNNWHVWSLTLFILLLLNPLSVLSESLWLSLGTIALIIYGMRGRLAPSGLWWKWGRVQFVIAVGLVPLSLLFFQQLSLISFVANCVAIPWLSLILCLCLPGIVFLYIFTPLSYGLFFCADKLITGLWFFLGALAHLPAASLLFYVPDMKILILLLVGILLLLAPRGIPGRYLGILWILPLFLYVYPKPEDKEFILSLLDVGQGLSAIVQTKNHLLVYDAGPVFYNQTNMGESVVLPYLRTLGARQIDMLVISHGDSDHIGGARSLMDALTINAIRTSVPEKIRTPVTDYCRSGMKWNWDGVDFSFIYPYHAPVKAKNDDSCVLRVENGERSILLTGDIEKFAEKQLIAGSSESLKSTILIAPHHGSKTSAVPGFITAVQPEFVLYATGYLNRYHFPNQHVVQAFTELKAVQLNTAETGTIKIDIGPMDMKVELYREMHRRYWYN